MRTAFVLVRTSGWAGKRVLKRLRANARVTEANPTGGTDDILAKIEGSTVNDLREVVGWIGRIVGVRSTLTIIARAN